MIYLVATHSMLVELHGGMITLAALCIIVTVLARSQLKAKSDSESNGISWSKDSLMGRIGRYTEPTAYVAALGGVLGLVASAIVGFFVWPMDLLTTSALGLSKVAFSIFAMVLLIEFVLVRFKYGESVWKNGVATAVYACLGLVGFLFIVLAGSFGGHMALKGSVLDPLFALLNINPLTFGVTGSNFAVLLIGVICVEIAVPIIVLMLLKRRAS